MQHSESLAKKQDRHCHLSALRMQLRQLQRETSVLISIETFTGHDRIFTPDEIIEAKLPMTLDTSHIHDDDKIISIIEKYWQRIPVVHLSERCWGNQKRFDT